VAKHQAICPELLRGQSTQQDPHIRYSWHCAHALRPPSFTAPDTVFHQRHGVGSSRNVDDNGHKHMLANRVYPWDGRDRNAARVYAVASAATGRLTTLPPAQHRIATWMGQVGVDGTVCWCSVYMQPSMWDCLCGAHTTRSHARCMPNACKVQEAETKQTAPRRHSVVRRERGGATKAKESTKRTSATSAGGPFGCAGPHIPASSNRATAGCCARKGLSPPRASDSDESRRLPPQVAAARCENKTIVGTTPRHVITCHRRPYRVVNGWSLKRRRGR